MRLFSPDVEEILSRMTLYAQGTMSEATLKEQIDLIAELARREDLPDAEDCLDEIIDLLTRIGSVLQVFAASCTRSVAGHNPDDVVGHTRLDMLTNEGLLINARTAMMLVDAIQARELRQRSRKESQ